MLHVTGRQPRRSVVVIMVASVVTAFFALPLVALAQNPFEAQTGEKKEAAIDQNFERKKLERAEGKEAAGPRLERDTNIKGWERDQLTYQDKAIRLMEQRLQQAAEDDPDYPLLLERLSEMYWQKAQYHDLRAFDRLTESRQAEDAGNTSKATDLERLQEEDEKTAQEYREKTIKVYARIIEEYPLYENSDKALFYLAFNLAEMGRAEDAHEFYQKLVRDYPDTDYLADAYLGLAEYAYQVTEDMPLALSHYTSTMQASPNSQAAGYAQYKMGWCYFNLGEPKKALAQFESVVDFSKSNPGRADLKKEAVKDLVKAYSLWFEASPKKAKKYFKTFADNDEHLNEMMERLARLYQEDGEVEKSNFVYNQLIKDNQGNFKIVGYQIEIMMNVETRNKPDDTAQEIIRTVQFYKKAIGDNLAGADEETVKKYYEMLEEYTRETAKWYHLTAQTTKNPLYYALAYEIYRAYVDNFTEAQDNYEMMYYYAELLYWKKNYTEAAKRYDQVVQIDEQGKYSQDAAYGAVLSYNRVAETPTKECTPIPVPPEAKAGEAPTFPEFTIVECREKLVAACDTYARLVPDGQYIGDIKYTAARIYYDHNRFDEAIKRFDDMARNNSDHRLSIVAANLLLDSLGIQKKYKQMWTTIQDFKKIPELYRPPLDEVLDGLEQQLAFKFCNEKEDAKKWEESALCYEEYASTYPNAEFAPKALWSASVDWENASEVGKAIETRIRLLKEHGDEEDLAPRALYAIGQNFHGIAVYSEAARFYELFTTKYPKNKTACVPIDQESNEPCSMFALQNAAAFRSGLGEYEQAVDDFDKYIRMFPKDQEQISELKFNTGRIYFDQAEFDKAIERYEEYLSRYAKLGPLSRKVAAIVAIGRCYWIKNDRRTGIKYFERAEKLYNGKDYIKWTKGAEEKHIKIGQEAAAEARFMRGEYIFRSALIIKLYDDEQQMDDSAVERYLQRQLKKKADLMMEAQPIYMEVITKFGTPKWGLAALCRLGMMYHDVADQIQNAPVPKRLNEEQSLIYEDLLLEFADKFEQQAIGYYVTAVTKAAELGWFSDYTTMAQRRLFDLRPEEYRSASEIKAQPSQMSIQYHRANFYDDVEAAAGRRAKKKRGPIDLNEEEMDKFKGGDEAGAEAAAGADNAKPAE